MRLKLVISLPLLFIGFLFGTISPARAALECHGSGPASIISSSCDYNQLVGTYSCGVSTSNYTSTCSFSGGCRRMGLGSTDDTGCSLSFDKKTCDVNPGGIPVYTTSGCWTCDNAIWSACSASCDGGTQTNQCGGTQSCNTQPCCSSSGPDTPTLSSPANGASIKGTTATLTWNGISNWGTECSSATSRDYQVCAGTNAGDPCSGGSVFTVGSGTTSQVYTFPDALPRTYYWKVKADNTNPSASGWSTIWSFNVTNNAPTIVSTSPSTVLSNGNANLTIVTSDADGATDLRRVFFAFNNCSVDPGDAGWSNFEHINANYFGGFTYGGANINVANNNTGAACTGVSASPPTPWGTVAPFTNALNTLTINNVSDTRAGNNWTSVFNVTTTNFPSGNYNYYAMVQDNELLWHTGGPSWKKMGTVCVEGGAVLGAWGACDGNHKRTRTCTETCGTDNCTAAGAVAGVITEDCVGTIKGTLFDASDLSSCPATIGTDPGYAPLRLGSAAFDILGLWPAITAPVSTDANGNYTEQVYASTVNGTYSFDYANLISSGRASGVKLQCQGASVSVTTQGQTVTKDTGFWRVYSGWWQAVGGSVYARSGVRSYVPASVTPAANQKLILPNAGGRVGVLSHGFVWQGTELGTNPNAGISSALWRIQSLYEGLRYDFNFYKTRMDVFPFTAWDGGAIGYSDGGRGYQIFKHTGDVTLNYSGPTGTQKVILLVDGNVTVSGNITVPSGAFLGVIAKNSIIFNSNLTTAQGWFVAESINVPCKDTVAPLGTCDKTDSQLDGQGSFVGWTGINLNRDMGAGNNTTPAEKFTYRVDMALNAPTPIKVFAKKFSPFIP